MYFDVRLWQFTEGFRGRIVATVLVGLLSAVVGIARLGLLGWLLARVFLGATPANLALPLALVAGAMVLRGVLEYVRSMMAHRTAASIPLALADALAQRRVADGDLVLLVGFGAGMTWASAVLRWDDPSLHGPGASVRKDAAS